MPSPRVFSESHSIHVKNLQLPAGIIAADIWGQEKVQPATVTLELKLRHGFSTAAAADELDNKTIHYGHLCKEIRSLCAAATPVHETLDLIANGISHMASASSIMSMGVKLTLPKACAYGSALEITADVQCDGPLGVISRPSFKVHYMNLNIMTLIGVNAQERTGLQSVLLTCSLESFIVPDQLLGLERMLVDLVQPTGFLTLEALAVDVANELQNSLDNLEEVQNIVLGFRILLEKPSAVVFADAPAVELRREYGTAR